MSQGEAVFYAVDDTPQYVCFAQKSIETIRKFDRQVFEAPAALFSKYRSRDFYAREEICTNLKSYAFVLGELKTNQIKRPQLARIAKKVKAAEVPVFNTGLMVFNRSSHVKALSALPLMELLRQKFRSGEWPYPSTNVHIADEVCMALAFGTLRNFNWGLLRREDAPWYVEWKGREVDSPGLVLHTWTHFYLGFCNDFLGERGLRQLRDRVQALGGANAPAAQKGAIARRHRRAVQTLTRKQT